MSDRPVSRRPRQQSASHPSPSDAVEATRAAEQGAPAENAPVEQEIAGVVAETGATRSGEDVRRRGWFWHWNSIVTQYAPLIGLKGVGLLNSYTVWTDRREESPTRGYAFPSQQSEADFYGEDRAELITINKLLVALDLIEIRKEMVLRVDERGRRWKVPHNFYRVKDHGDGSSLTSRDVLQVAELADRDTAVYRYVRRVFSPRFAPIDPNNVWGSILEEVRQTEVWQHLAARAQRDEQRASDRTRAGHAARKGSLSMPPSGDTAASQTTVNDSESVRMDGVGQTSVANTNTGSTPDVAPTNDGFDGGFDLDPATNVGASNRGRATAVDQSNRTYNQDPLTTTTTTAGPNESISNEPAAAHAERESNVFDKPDGASQRPVTAAEPLVTAQSGSGPGGLAAPADAPGEEAAVRAFEDANGRRSTPAERQLLRGLADRFHPAARERSEPGRDTGWAWLTAAVYEAVEAGSAFVAPRRLREIMARWEREGLPSGDGSRQTADGSDQPSAVSRQHGTETADLRLPAADSVLGDAPDFALPHGFGSRRTWEFAISLLSGALEPGVLRELVAGTAIVGYRDGEVTIAAPDANQAERIAGDYAGLIARKLGEAMRRPVRLAVLLTAPPAGPPGDDRTNPGERTARSLEPAGASADHSSDPVIPVFIVAECGLPSPQVWAAVLDEIAAAGSVSAANIDAWLRTTRLIGRTAEGGLVIGAAHGLAQRRIADRFARPLRAAVAAVLGREAPLEIVVTHNWLLAPPAPQASPDEADADVA